MISTVDFTFSLKALECLNFEGIIVRVPTQYHILVRPFKFSVPVGPLATLQLRQTYHLPCQVEQHSITL